MTDAPPPEDRRGDASRLMRPGQEPTSGMPGWVKAFAVAGVVLVVVLALLLLTGHGPGRHMASADPGQPHAVSRSAGPASA